VGEDLFFLRVQWALVVLARVRRCWARFCVFSLVARAAAADVRPCACVLLVRVAFFLARVAGGAWALLVLCVLFSGARAAGCALSLLRRCVFSGARRGRCVGGAAAVRFFFARLAGAAFALLVLCVLFSGARRGRCVGAAVAARLFFLARAPRAVRWRCCGVVFFVALAAGGALVFFFRGALLLLAGAAFLSCACWWWSLRCFSGARRGRCVFFWCAPRAVRVCGRGCARWGAAGFLPAARRRGGAFASGSSARCSGWSCL
jgi:hypothetical protein